MQSENRGVLISGPDGTIYNIPFAELNRFVVPQEAVERTILDAEAAGLLAGPGGDVESAAGSPGGAPAPPGATVINIFVSPGAEPLTQIAGASPGDVQGFATMAKYSAGSTMAKYSAGSTMAKYSAGSTMTGFGAVAPTATFYGSWV
jgi:hypothetical protein